MDPKDKNFLKFLKKNNVDIINAQDAFNGWEITMQGKRKDLEAVLADDEYGWDDPELAEYIEESAIAGEVNERSINKIQKEWSKVTVMMKDTLADWKQAEGQEKEDLLTQLKTLTISKNKLEAELDAAIGLKDADVELVGEATMQEIDKKVQKFVIKNANEYDYSNQDSAFQIYLSLKKLYPRLIKESAVTEVNEDLKDDLKKYIDKNREEIDNLVDNDAWDKAYMMILNDFNVEQETPEGENMITLFNELY